MVWEGSSVGVLLKFGRCSIDQEPRVKNLSFVRRQGWGVTSKVGGRWKGLFFISSREAGRPNLKEKKTGHITHTRPAEHPPTEKN